MVFLKIEDIIGGQSSIRYGKKISPIDPNVRRIREYDPKSWNILMEVNVPVSETEKVTQYSNLISLQESFSLAKK